MNPSIKESQRVILDQIITQNACSVRQSDSSSDTSRPPSKAFTVLGILYSWYHNNVRYIPCVCSYTFSSETWYILTDSKSFKTSTNALPLPPPQKKCNEIILKI